MKILLATEGSDFSKAAVERCGELFTGSDDLDIRIVSAVAPVITSAEPFAVSAEYIHQLDAAGLASAEQVLSEAGDSLREYFPGDKARVETKVLHGNPAKVIVEEAETWGADLMIVGSHGYGFWQRALLGSVSNAVVNHAPCSVLVVRPSNGDGDKEN